MQHFDYDIFISYRRHDCSNPEMIKEDVGTNIARSLYYALTNEGYDVYFDCELGGSPNSDRIMGRSRLILLLLADYSLTDSGTWDDNNRIGGLHKELYWISEKIGVKKTDKKIPDESKRIPGVPFILPISIDKALDNDNNLPYYRWIKSIDFVNLHTNEDFGIFFQNLVGVLQGKKPEIKINIQSSHETRGVLEHKIEDVKSLLEQSKIEIDQTALKLRASQSRLRFVTRCLFATLLASILLGIILWINTSRDVIVTTGNNTVSEYLKGNGECFFHEFIGDGMAIDNTKHRFFFHSDTHDGDVLKSLKAAFRRPADKNLGNFPILLTTNTIADTLWDSIYTQLEMRDKGYRILEYEIERINLVLYIFSQDTAIIAKELDLTQDTLSPDDLINLLQKKNERILIMGTKNTSNITKAFNDYIHKCDTINIDTYRDMIFQKYDTNIYKFTIENHLKDNGIVILFDNISVRNAPLLKEKIKEGKVKEFIVPQKIPLYAYTFIKLVGSEGKSEIKFINGQDRFFKAKRMQWGSNETPYGQYHEKIIHVKSKNLSYSDQI